MIRLATVNGVRERAAPGQSFERASEQIVADLATGWTVISPHTSKPQRDQEVVWLYGREWRYVARLYGYELPEGWCICPPSQQECQCRRPGSPKDTVAVWLVGASPITERDYKDIQDGERHQTPFTTRDIPERDWYGEAAAAWTAAHRRRRRAGDERGALRRWRMVLEVRRLAVEYLAQPLAYEDVEVDDRGQLLFELSPGEGPVPLETIYELPGHKTAKLRTIDSEGAMLVCDVEGTDPVAACDYARARRTDHRRLVRDQAATGTVLKREEQTFRDLINGRARNLELRDLLADPTRALAPPRQPTVEAAVQPQLDRAQREAVAFALESRDIAVVQGPPGTGKTTFIAELISRHLRKHPGDRVLMASQTHQATDHLLAQLHELEPDIPLVRVGRDLKKIAPEVRRFWVHATEPWQSGVRERVMRYRKHLRARVTLDEQDQEQLGRIVAIQDRYLGNDAAGPAAQSRVTDARVLAGTCYGVSSSREARELTYDLAIVEEAGKATPAEALMAIVRADRVLLVGDSRQLAPTPDRALDKILRQAAKDPTAIEDPKLRKKATELARDLEQERERLLQAGHDAPPRFTAETLFTYLARRFAAENPGMQATLRTQYRMVSGIGELISDVFYEGELEHGRHRAGKQRDPRATATTAAHVRLLDVQGEATQAPGSTSWSNQQEVRVAIRELQALNRAAGEPQQPGAKRRQPGAGPQQPGAKHRQPGQNPLGVAVITGYLAQQRALRRALRNTDLPNLKVRLGLLDSFQGDEEEVVIVSITRTDRPGYLSERNRVNVALSRAKSLLIVLVDGHAARTGTLGKPIKEVLAYIDHRIDTGDQRYETETIKRGRRKTQSRQTRNQPTQDQQPNRDKREQSTRTGRER